MRAGPKRVGPARFTPLTRPQVSCQTYWKKSQPFTLGPTLIFLLPTQEKILSVTVISQYLALIYV